VVISTVCQLSEGGSPSQFIFAYQTSAFPAGLPLHQQRKKGYPKLSFCSLLITINIMAETIIGEPVTVSLNDLKTGEMSIPRKGLDHYADTTWVRLHQF
jgi:hypothetical protein